jgi:hypothetical protein
MPAAETAPAWAETSLPWLLLVIALCAAALVALGAALLARLRALERGLGALALLEDLKRAVGGLAEREDDLDLRRLEHVLIDIRDGQRRLEDALLAVSEGPRSAVEAPERGAPGAPGARGSRPVELADRVVTRLLALGYERVLLVTPHAELAALVDGDGEIVVEARRDGAICKGRVAVRGGRITEVQVQPAYSAFP